jgi:hypothetical protein
VAPFCKHAFELYGLAQFVRVWFEVLDVGMCIVSVRRCGDASNECGAR